MVVTVCVSWEFRTTEGCVGHGHRYLRGVAPLGGEGEGRHPVGMDGGQDPRLGRLLVVRAFNPLHVWGRQRDQACRGFLGSCDQENLGGRFQLRMGGGIRE